ncbi:hypothetical protein BDB01DRAFT_781129 [Pilobolus umbonatus]|nr:hypothetical protein BDB01DRAFT_781129 [Pilobolus umbonatus]
MNRLDHIHQPKREMFKSSHSDIVNTFSTGPSLDKHRVNSSQLEVEDESEDEEDDDDDILPYNPELMDVTLGNISPLPTDSSEKCQPFIFSLSSVDTYSPQLAFNLYSPCDVSTVSQINDCHQPKSCIPNPITIEQPLRIDQLPPLSVSPPTLSFSTKKASSTSLPQLTSSQPSRLISALQKLRGSSIHRPSTSLIELPSIVKTTSSTKSLANKIKTKFQKQLEKKNRLYLHPKSTFAAATISRCISLSSISSCSQKEKREITRNRDPPSRTESFLPLSSSFSTVHKIDKKVCFDKIVSVRETFSKTDYDRGSDAEAVCNRLTSILAQKIKEELNNYKLYEMQVHESSRVNTHFFT